MEMCPLPGVGAGGERGPPITGDGAGNKGTCHFRAALPPQKSHKNQCFFNVFDHNSAQITCLKLSRGLVMVTSHEESDFDSPGAQNHRKTCFLHKISDFKVFA